MERLLLSCKLISKEMLEEMLQIQSGDLDEEHYGYGIWLKEEDSGSLSPYFEGCDPGVSFISLYHLDTNTTITVVSNYGDNVWKIMGEIRGVLLKE